MVSIVFRGVGNIPNILVLVLVLILVLILAQHIAKIFGYWFILVYIGWYWFVQFWKTCYICLFRAWKWPRNINTETVTKIVPMRAVSLSTGPLWTEFLCDRFRRYNVFSFRVDLLLFPGRFLVDFRMISVRFQVDPVHSEWFLKPIYLFQIQ